MKTFLVPIAALLAGLAAQPAAAMTPAINCRVAATPIELAICDVPSFVAMDREIAALYDRGLAEFDPGDRRELVEGQLAFLRVRDRCIEDSVGTAHPGVAVSECIRISMERRVARLRRAVDRGGYAR